MISVSLGYENNEKLVENKPSVNLHGTLELSVEGKSAVEAAKEAIATLKKFLGNNIRANCSITLEDDGTKSIMVNVAQVK